MGRKSRSPNYPRLTLAEAISRIEKLYKAEHTHVTDREAVAQGLGYTSLNGASLGVISTLKQYGLLQEEADGLRVSDDAVALLMLPEGDSERVSTLQKVAFMPRLFSELREEYGDTLPSDVSLRYALIKKGFIEKAANEVIRTYRDTLELVSEESEEYTEADVEDQREVGLLMTQPTGSGSVVADVGSTRAQQGMVAPTAILQFQISKNSAARIELTGDVTQEAIERLALILDAQKLVFPTENQVEQPAIGQSFEQPAIESSE